ncbi:hypothetical protein E2P81_ATG00088 [Venturia nashicola]|uniref:Uncharacterized protein n=1 Tax=Venturia nashicola TaxID=86259 RepID=A0A4Z1PSQ7_9PEZI|nr:hypothetical protein E6O75_ATG00095 [Venturia nashicola]TLD39101.1 hypothetical protein E2P81_ATG00088 [Venturia nashicola]
MMSEIWQDYAMASQWGDRARFNPQKQWAKQAHVVVDWLSGAQGSRSRIPPNKAQQAELLHHDRRTLVEIEMAPCGCGLHAEDLHLASPKVKQGRGQGCVYSFDSMLSWLPYTAASLTPKIEAIYDLIVHSNLTILGIPPQSIVHSESNCLHREREADESFNLFGIKDESDEPVPSHRRLQTK